MSSIGVVASWNLKLISDNAGSTESTYKDGKLHCNCPQDALDASLAAYDHDAHLLSLEPTYRDLRSLEYKSRCSPEGSFETTVGDILDALIKAHYGDSTELDQLAVLIAEIKTEIPET